MKTQLYLHIGRPKTGSTALQHFLMHNRKALLEYKLLYPLTGNYQLSSHLFAYAYADDLRRQAHLPEIDAALLWSQLAEEVKASAAASVVLSSENFWFSDPEKIRGDLSERYDVRVVAYIRRQDHVVASSFCEEVKRGQITLQDDIDKYALYGPRLQLLDYFRILERWGECFGVDNIDVRVYESLGSGGIAGDFCGVLGVDDTLVDSDDQSINPALPYDVLSMISNLGKFKAGDAARRRFVTALSESVAMLGADLSYSAAGLFSTELRARILSHFRDSNQAILDKFLPEGGESLFPSLADETYIKPLDTFDGERHARLMMGMHAHQEKVNVRLVRRLGKLEQQLEQQEKLLQKLLGEGE